MKKLFLIAALMVATVSTFAQVKFGVGVVAANDAALNSSGKATFGYGLNGRAYYSFPKFDVSGGVTYIIPSKYEHDISTTGSSVALGVSFLQFNVDAHYKFYEVKNIALYGIGGLNYTVGYAKLSYDIASSDKAIIDASNGAGYADNFYKEATTSTSGIGVDLGVGAKYSNFFLEGKYDGQFDGLVFTLGYNF